MLYRASSQCLCVPVGGCKGGEEGAQHAAEPVLLLRERVEPQDKQLGQELLARHATTQQQLGYALSSYLTQEGALQVVTT